MLVRARGGKTEIPTGWCVSGGASRLLCKLVEEAVPGVGPDPVRREDPLLAKPVTRGGRILPRTAAPWDRGGSGESAARHRTGGMGAPSLPHGIGTLGMDYWAGVPASRTMATSGIGREVFDWYAAYRLLLVPFISCQSRG